MKVCIMQEHLTKNVFASLIQHDIDNHDPLGEDLHSTQLCKKIAHKYLDMRLFRYQQTFTDDIIRKGKIGVRQKLTKSIIFGGL